MYTRRVGTAIASLFVVALAGFGAPAVAAGKAVERPFAGEWEWVQSLEPVPGQCPAGQTAARDYGVGRLSHVGRVELETRGCIDATGMVTGVTMYTAPNGDELNVRWSYSLTDFVPNPDGSYTLVVEADEAFGTGRFLNATLDATDTGTYYFEPVSRSGHIEGTITYNASDRRN